MKITLTESYFSTAMQLAELEKEIEEVEKVLKTPSRTLEDLIRHMQLVKQRNTLL